MTLTWDSPLPLVGDPQTALTALLVGLGTWAALKLLRWLFLRIVRLQQSRNPGPLDGLLLRALDNVGEPVVLLVALFCGLRMLPLPALALLWLGRGLWLVGAFQFSIWSGVVASFVVMALERVLPQYTRPLSALKLGIKLLLWLVVAITTLSNLGVDVSSLLTGLGIGGVAVALASQKVIGDLLATATIALDRPFAEGDFITSGEHSGKVLKVGLKTSRLRSPVGEELVIPNADLVNHPLRNWGKLEQRQVTQVLLISWDTPAELLEVLPSRLKMLVDADTRLRFDTAGLIGSSEAGLKLELCYTVLGSGYAQHLEAQQRLLVGVAQLWSELGVRPGRLH
jgi:small-conductance mechanosensitive channel